MFSDTVLLKCSFTNYNLRAKQVPQTDKNLDEDLSN